MSKFLKPERLFVEPNSPNGQRKWNHWYRTFMNYMDSIEDIAVVQKLNVLINHVDARIYEYISNANTFDEAIRILETVFVKETNEVLARHRLATCKQKSNQSLDEYLQTLQTISEECNFVEVSATRCRDEAIRDAFIAGICSNEIRQQLLEIRQLNLLETFCKARMLDMSYLAPEKLNTVNTCSINDLNSLCSNDARIITSDNGSYTDQEIDFKATNQSFSPTVGNNSTSIEATSDEELHLQPADERFLSLKSNENVDTNYYLLDPSNEYDSSFSDSEDIETLRKIGEEATKHSSWMQPSYVASSTHSAQVPQSHHTTSMQASSPSFYPQQSPQQLYHRHAAPLQTFSPYQDNISFQPTTHPPMHSMTQINAPPPVQPLPQSTQPARRKAITIRDPSTMKDVTDDIMQSGKQPLASSPSVRSATPGQQPVAAAQAPTDQIVAQFAHQVAVVAAKDTPDKSSATSSVSTASVTPSNIDSSVPQHSFQSLPSSQTQSHGSNTIAIAQEISSESSKPVTLTSAHLHNAAEVRPVLSKKPPQVQLVNPTSHIIKTRPEAPVAVVQPISHNCQNELSALGDNAMPQTQSKPDSIKNQQTEDKIHKIEEKAAKHSGEPQIEFIGTAVDADKVDNVEIMDTSVISHIALEFNVATKIEPSSLPPEANIKPVEDNSSKIQSPDLSNISKAPTDSSNVTDQTNTKVDISSGDSVEITDSTSTVVSTVAPAPSSDTVDPLPEVRQASHDVKIDAKAVSGEALPLEDSKEFVDAKLEQLATTEDGKINGATKIINKDDSKPMKTDSVNDAKDSPAETPLVTDNMAPGTISQPRENEKDKEEATPPAKEDEATIDPDAKKQYNRDFLMQFRYHNASLEKPRGLPAIEDIIMDRPYPKTSTSNQLPSMDGGMYGRGGNADFTPNYMRGGRNNSHGGWNSNSRGMRGSGQSQQGGYGGGYKSSGGKEGKPIKTVSIKREPEPELKKSENAWKPSKVDQKVGGVGDATEESQTAEVLKQVRAILNKLTPQKFSSLMEKVQRLPINTESRLRGVIDLIFEKAIDEPNFCEAYANMCRTMSQFRLTTTATSTQTQQGTTTVEFRKILLTRCQREFEKDRTNEETMAKLRQKLQEATTPEEKQVRREELEYEENKERRRMLGNIRFIGELFKLRMLTESIMHNCIMSLFKGRDDESLESLCRLLTTIGKDLDHVKGKQRMDQYFQQVDKIIRERKTSPRVRFMLQDVVDLRKNQWVQRAVKAQGPKTIDQIHADAKEEKEQQAIQAAVAASAAAANPPVKSQSRGNRRGGQSGGDDGWTKVPQKVMYDPNKMKLSKISQNFDENSVMLGPRGKHGWKSGSSSNMTKTGSGSHGRDRDSDSNTAPRSSTPTMMNRFSALGASAGQDLPYMQRTSGRISSREGSKSGSRGSTGSGSSGGYRESGRMERRGPHDAANANAKRVTSQENKIARRDLTPVSKGSTDSIPDQKLIVDVAAIEKVYKGIITEYFHIVDIKECYECFIAVNVAPEATFHFVKLALEMSLEKSSTDRSNVAQLLSNFVKRGLIKPEVYLKGALVNMELAVEIELDLPKVWSCVSEQLTPMFYDSGNKIQLRHLEKLAQPLLEFQKADVFVAEILKCLMKQVSVDAALRQWNESGLSWEYFLQTSDHSVINEFLQKHDLKAFYSSTNAAVSTKTSALPTRCNINSHYSEVVKQLEMGKSNDEIIDWLETKSDHVSESTFIRALTTAVCEKSIIQTDHQLEVDKDILKGRCSLLKKFIDNEDEELQAVYALQRLYLELEQPPNVLKLLFDALYDEDVISEQTFFKWEKDNNPAESEGKGVAMLSVNPFFTWLREADEVESDE